MFVVVVVVVVVGGGDGGVGVVAVNDILPASVSCSPALLSL